jgi:hypothetical protein
MDMTDFLLIAAVLLATLALLWGATTRSRRLPFTRRPSLLTAAEMRFYRALLRAAPPGMAVCIKVRLLDVVSVPNNAWRTHGTKGSGMHLDFVIAASESLEPRLVIELDDRSHARLQARQRDDFKNAALAAAGLPILRIIAAGRYYPTDLRARIRGALAGVIDCP